MSCSAPRSSSPAVDQPRTFSFGAIAAAAFAGGGVLLVERELGAIAAVADVAGVVLRAAVDLAAVGQAEDSSSPRSPPPPTSRVVACSWSSANSATSSARSPPRPTSASSCSSPRLSSPAVDQAEDVELSAIAAADLAGGGVLPSELELGDQLGTIAAATDLAGGPA